ncbi:MAG: dTDP-glucose 4,6-dehydratase [Candidatus Omnitrophica bacterium]|nr:dTDP-glucose 4,6-dehydratase [Candidatus Omnitrophota bacterium]MBU4457638.1 dTDP-glucose 4,6-dehydratase [Candidatus Omnitrophota bacterium]
MKMLITGGCGFIGSNFVRYILKKHPSYKVINLDKLTYCGCKENLKDIEKDKRYKFVKGDICDEKIVGELIKGCDAILNFAAESHVDRSINDAKEFVRTNVEGVRVLLDAARKNKVKRVIQVSTDETYGSIQRGSFNETSLLHPNSPYAASKAAGDHLALAYYTTFKTPVIVTRSSNNFGPYQFPEKVIPLFITNLLENKKVPLYGDGLNVRDWLYVLDNCRAIDMILHKGKTGEIYNIGGEYEIPNIKLTRIILKLLNKTYNMIKYVPDRLGHDRRYSLDSTKIKRLGWKPAKDFNTAIRETIKWYENNMSWWKELK